MECLDDPNFPKGGLAIKPSFDKNRFNINSNEISIKDSDEDISQYGIAGRIWEASYLFQHYLNSTSTKRFDPSPLDILQSDGITIELGAGVGLVGIHLAKQFQLLSKSKSNRVILTDLQNVVPLMKRNAEKAGINKNVIEIKSLPWGSIIDAKTILDDLRTKQEKLTNILCSDLVYFPELLPPLLRTLIQLTSFEDTATIYISYKIRSLAKEEPFWRAFGAWFDFKPVLCSNSFKGKFQPWRIFGSQKSDMYGFNQKIDCEKVDEEAEDDVFLFVGKRKHETINCHADVDDTKLMQGFMMIDGKLHQGNGTETFELILFSSLQG